MEYDALTKALWGISSALERAEDAADVAWRLAMDLRDKDPNNMVENSARTVMALIELASERYDTAIRLNDKRPDARIDT